MTQYGSALDIAGTVAEDPAFPYVTGWLEVCRGYVNDAVLPAHFTKAAKYFEMRPWPSRGDMDWWTVEKSVIGPYFNTRAFISASGLTTADQWTERLMQAKALLPVEVERMTYPPAYRMGLLLEAVLQLLVERTPDALDELVGQYTKEIEVWGEFESDGAVPRALERLRDGMLRFASHPGRALVEGELHKGITAIEALPARTPARFLASMADALQMSRSRWRRG